MAEQMVSLKALVMVELMVAMLVEQMVSSKALRMVVMLVE